MWGFFHFVIAFLATIGWGFWLGETLADRTAPNWWHTSMSVVAFFLVIIPIWNDALS